MSKYTLTHLSDAELFRRLAILVARDRANEAMLLAHMAEVDDRGLYRPAECPSMHAYCVEKMRFSEDAAFKRIRAARAGRKFPELFAALAEGRLHLAALYLLAPHFTTENLNELIETASYKTKAEIEEIIAVRFGAPGVPVSMRPMIRAVSPIPSEPVVTSQLETAPVEEVPNAGQPLDFERAPINPQQNYPQLAPGPVEGTQVQSLPQNCPVFLVRLVVPKSTRDKLSHAQALLSHAVPVGDLAQVLDRALDALISALEKRRFGVGTRELAREPSADAATSRSRHIPVVVRRAVWNRDGGRCTFISITGGRCRSRRDVQLDHVVPFARGGKPTVANLRLRCSAHNQFEAERVFGREFMRQKRQEAAVEDFDRDRT